MREYHILNLGAGVQSTTLYLMGMRGELEHDFDVAIFADPQDEPQETVDLCKITCTSWGAGCS